MSKMFILRCLIADIVLRYEKKVKYNGPFALHILCIFRQNHYNQTLINNLRKLK